MYVVRFKSYITRGFVPVRCLGTKVNKKLFRIKMLGPLFARCLLSCSCIRVLCGRCVGWPLNGVVVIWNREWEFRVVELSNRFALSGCRFALDRCSNTKVYLFTFVYLHFYARAVLHNSTHFITIENKGKIKIVQIYTHTYMRTHAHESNWYKFISIG